MRAIAAWLTVLLLANAVFLAIRVADVLLPRPAIEAALGEGFASGGLGPANYSTSHLLGIDQYTDCTSMQIAVLGNTPALRNALAPRLASGESPLPGEAAPPTRYRCAELREALDGTLRIEGEPTYTRFWHGQSTLLALALQVLPLDGYRALLLDLGLGLIALAAVLAALRGRRVLVCLAPLLLASFVLGGQFGFGQLVSHAPGQIVAWAMAVVLIARWDRLGEPTIRRLAVLAGALEAFFDMMIGQPFAVSLFLIVAGTLSLAAARPPGLARAAAATFARAMAWGFGLAGSFGLKLLLTASVLGGEAVFGPFLAQLRLRTGIADPQAGLAAGSWADAVGRDILLLANEASNLGYTAGGSGPASAMIVAAGLAGWLWLADRARRAWRDGRLGTLLANGTGYGAAALLFLAWVAIFPEHTWRHAWFMVRAASVWLFGGWGWALTDLVLSGWMPTRSAAISAAAPSLPRAGRTRR